MVNMRVFGCSLFCWDKMRILDRRSVSLAFFFFFIYLAQSSALDAQEGQRVQDEILAVPNRPTFASTAETVQRGVFEVEYGFEAAKGHQNINGLLKWGVFKNLELWFLNNPIQRDAGVAGMGDSGAGFKFAMIPQKKAIPKVAVLYVATLPTASAGLGAGASGHSVQMLLSKALGQHH